MELGLMVKYCLKKDEPEIIEDANGGNQIELADSVNRHQQDEQSQGPVIQWDRILPFRSLKVLLVEDDDSTRHLVSALLRNCSYEVTAVANGLEAWKVLIDLNKQIDLVLTEVVMPYLSGIGLLSKIMNLVPRKNIPVIMMSSDDSMGIVFNCLSKGAVDFLVKPIRKNELKNLWQHVWRKCHSSSGSESDSGAGSGADKPTNARCIEVSDDESDDGSGNQVIYARPDKDNTIKHTGEDNKLDAIAMGKDLAIGAPINSSNVKETRYVLKRSDLSAFSRYNNTTSNANQAPTTNISSCSPTDVNINLETAKQVNTQSKSNGPVNQPSNGSSTLNNDTGSSTIIAALDDGSSRNMVYNGVTEGNYGSASGSNNNTSNGENGNNDETEACDNGVTEKGKSGNMNLSVGGSNDQDRLAQREAALNKFRLKRKERCFEKKVRYQSRKKLAEQRPRVRGQFVRKGKDTDS